MKLKHFLGHLLFWVIIMLTYAFSEWGYRNNFFEAILFELIFLPVRLVAVYLNWLVYIPRLLYKNHILGYLLILTITLIILALMQRYFTLYWAFPVFFPDWISQPPQPLLFTRIVQNAVIISPPVAFSIGIKIFLDWYKQKNMTNQLKIEKREAELKYLRAQINPHFLFNTLNNLYGLSIEKSIKVPSLILKLSDILSYSLYGSTAEKVTVKEEIKIIKDYINLECERFEDKVTVQWNIDESALGFQIAPLLYMPLVENAFKHGVNEKIGHADLSIKLVLENNWLLFEVINTYPDSIQKQHTPGIGLTNLHKRLKLLYPERYLLKTHRDGNNFISMLKLSIND